MVPRRRGTWSALEHNSHSPWSHRQPECDGRASRGPGGREPDDRRRSAHAGAPRRRGGERGAGGDDVVDQQDPRARGVRAGPEPRARPAARPGGRRSAAGPGSRVSSARHREPGAAADRAGEQLRVIEAAGPAVLRGGRRPRDDVDGGGRRRAARPSRPRATRPPARALRYFTARDELARDAFVRERDRRAGRARAASRAAARAATSRGTSRRSARRPRHTRDTTREQHLGQRSEHAAEPTDALGHQPSPTARRSTVSA